LEDFCDHYFGLPYIKDFGFASFGMYGLSLIAIGISIHYFTQKPMMKQETV
jgi:hypothetical protein